jgi:tRNA threonylcarbamoyladenosine biosynthesis protein TsaB
MKLLALETCFGKYSLALFDGEKLLASMISSEENKQAEQLILALEKILADNSLSYSALDAIAVCVGPGSFTGLRIGLAAAKGVALATGIKLIGVSSLAAAAEKKGGYPVYLNASRSEAFSQASETAEPELIPHSGQFDELATAIEVGKVALNPAAQHLTPEPLYVRKPDAKPSKQSA